MRRIKVKVIPNAKKNEVLKQEEKFKIYITASPVSGKANKALIKLLAVYFKVKKNCVKIVKGEKGREKVIEINI